MDLADRLILRTPLYAARDRYDGGRAVTPGGLARPRPSEGVRSAVAAVADPWPDPARDPLAEPERVHVTVNRCTDLLEREASHGRISREAYLVGRVIAEVFERRAGPRGSGSPEGGNRVDHTVAHELAILLAIDDGRLVEGLLDKLREAIGTVGTRFLHQVLAEGRDFAGLARGLGRGDGRAAVAGVAQRFRDLLEDVAADWLAQQSGQGPRRAGSSARLRRRPRQARPRMRRGVWCRGPEPTRWAPIQTGAAVAAGLEAPGGGAAGAGGAGAHAGLAVALAAGRDRLDGTRGDRAVMTWREQHGLLLPDYPEVNSRHIAFAGLVFCVRAAEWPAA